MPTPQRILALASLLLILGACSTPPRVVPPPSAPPPPAQPAREQFQADLGDGFSVHYQIERKQSSVSSAACFAFITGTLVNQSTRTLSRESVLDIAVFHQGRQIFRDLTRPVSDIPPGGRAMFEMVDSPVHRTGCPSYERIRLDLRKVFKS